MSKHAFDPAAIESGELTEQEVLAAFQAMGIATQGERDKLRNLAELGNAASPRHVKGIWIQTGVSSSFNKAI